MRLAVLADIHGNLPALRAVLAELDRDPVDAIVVAGDACGGPLARSVLDHLAARSGPVHWIAGNAEREALAVYDGGDVSDDPAGRAAGWTAAQLDGHWRAAIAGWPIALTLDGVCFCHGSPRRDDEILTRGTPDAALAAALDGLTEPLVVGGHTHQQLIREAPGAPAYANGGSIGLPYEGRDGAYWMVVADGRPQLRVTGYDLPAALAELRTSGFPDLDDFYAESLIAPVDPNWVTAFFEHAAGRKPDPGPAPNPQLA